MSEIFGDEIEKTKGALVEAYCRLKDVFEDIEKFNKEDNFDELELCTARREALFERIEYLRARLQPEAADYVKLRAKELPSEIVELKAELNEYRRDLDEQLRPEIVGILITLFELGAQQTGGSTIKLPDGYGRFLKQAASETSNRTTGAKIRREIKDKEQDLKSPSRMNRICSRVESLARTAATERNGFDFSRHFMQPFYKGRK